MDQQISPTPRKRWPRVLVSSLVALVIIAGIILIIRLAILTRPVAVNTPVDALANSNDDCVACHRNASPGIVQQFGASQMAANKVTCRDCHVVAANYPGAAEHEGDYILNSPTTAMCQRCHEAETAQFHQSRHALPAYVAVMGSKDLSPAQLAQYQSIPEGSFSPNKERHILAQMEGSDITRFACETCHNVGKPAADGSVGQCQKCHLRHEFSLEQARKPETCNACHIGPDHPQWEIYQESAHGIAYSVNGATWNWSAETGTLTVKDFPAPTCATCHFSGFGGTSTTHKVGERLTWYLFASLSERRPSWQDNKLRMTGVCLECHNKTFVDTFYTDADKEVAAVNGFVQQGNDIMANLTKQNLVTPAQFDEPIDYTQFELWHNWGRTAKFGAWMQGPDYTQWHGAYEMLKAITDLKDMAAQKQQAAGK
ncbi:MAG TPA: multiheme c-type cytochrome [Anaerolineales bacterium]